MDLFPAITRRYRCPSCRSHNVDVPVQGLPDSTLFSYQHLYEAESRELSEQLFCEATGHQPRANDDDTDFTTAFLEWFCPEEGRGLYAPGNRLVFTGCVIDNMVLLTDEGDSIHYPYRSCRECGEIWN